MITPETLLDLFEPPEGMVGRGGDLLAMTADKEDLLEDAMERFTRLRPRQRPELGTIVAYLMLDGHASAARQNVLPPGRVPGLHEMQPRQSDARFCSMRSWLFWHSDQVVPESHVTSGLRF